MYERKQLWYNLPYDLDGSGLYKATTFYSDEWLHAGFM